MPRIFISIVNYLKTAKWLLLDSVFRFRKNVLLIIIAQTIGTLMQASAVGLAIKYVNLLETGSDYTLGNFTFETEAVSFINVALIISGFLIVGASLVLLFRLKIFEVGYDYQKFCSQRVFNIFFRNRYNPQYNIKYGNSEVSSLAGVISSRCGRVLRMALETIRPAGIFIIATGIILFYNPILTIILGGLALVSLIFQYYISRDVTKYSVIRDEYGTNISKFRKKILSDAAKFPSNMESSLFERNITKKFKEETTSYYEVTIGWLAGAAKSGFISEILLAVSVFLVLVTLISGVLETGEGWVLVITYILALRFAFANLRALNSHITGINRFYPQISGYKRYIDEFSQPKYALTQDIRLIHLDRNYVYSLILQKGLTVDAFLQIIDVNTESGIAYIGTDFPFGDISFAESLGMRDLSRQDYWAVIQNMDVAELFKQNVKDIMNEEKPSRWDGVDSRLVLLMMLTTFIQSQTVYAIVNVDDVQNISRSTWDYVSSLIKEKTVIINHNHSLDSIGNYAEKGVIFLHDETFDIFSLNEFKNSESSIREMVKLTAPRKDVKTYDAESAEIDSTEDEEFI